MIGIPRTIILGGKPFNTEHKLNEYNNIESIKQKKRELALKQNETFYKEVDELTKVGILREVKYQTWVANPVMVKKNAYKGYHQIQMAEGYEDKTTFFIGKGVFCYRKMSFGLKNAGKTCQSASEEDMLMDIQETFDRLRSINMKINSKKCSFDGEEGPFLGHLITKQGIKANPSKVKAITIFKPPRTLKEIHSLNGKLATLSQFLSKGADKSLPFFKALKSCLNKKTIQWTIDAEEAF
ncbi:hypothetical protein Tco_0864203 [Tanacetum coccineum]